MTSNMNNPHPRDRKILQSSSIFGCISFVKWRLKMALFPTRERFPLEKLPYNLALSVLEKIPFFSSTSGYTRMKLELCSIYSSSLCNSSSQPKLWFTSEITAFQTDCLIVDGLKKKKFHHQYTWWRYLEKLNIQILTERLVLMIGTESSGRFESLERFCEAVERNFLTICEQFRKHQIQAKEIHIDNKILLSTDAFVTLLEHFKPCSLHFASRMPLALLDHSYVQMIETISIDYPIPLEKLLALQASNISVVAPSLDATVINQLIKEWKFGSRKLKKLCVSIQEIALHSLISDQDSILDGINANLVWTVLDIPSSIRGIVMLPFCRPLISIYSLWRSDSVADFKIITFELERFTICSEFEREFDVFPSIVR